ncbi:MAG: hypothetical protein AB4352_07195 [Hormoscilla sp.]
MSVSELGRSRENVGWASPTINGHASEENVGWALPTIYFADFSETGGVGPAG